MRNSCTNLVLLLLFMQFTQAHMQQLPEHRTPIGGQAVAQRVSLFLAFEEVLTCHEASWDFKTFQSCGPNARCAAFDTVINLLS